MKFTFDTDAIKDKITDMKVNAQANKEIAVAKALTKKAELQEKKQIKKEDKSLESMQADLEFLDMLADWNVERHLSGKPMYIPQDGLTAGPIDVLKEEISLRIKAKVPNN